MDGCSSTSMLCRSRQRRTNASPSTDVGSKARDGENQVRLTAPNARTAIARLLALFETGDFGEMESLFSPTATYCISGTEGQGLFWRGRPTLVRNLRIIRQHMLGKVSITWRIVHNSRNTTQCVWRLVCYGREGAFYRNSGTLKVRVVKGVIVAVEEMLDLDALKRLVGAFQDSVNVSNDGEITAGGK